MGSRSSPSLAGMEVAISGSDSVNWIELSINTSSPPFSLPSSLAPPPTEDAASSHIIDDPPFYFTWRIHKTSPNALELLQISPSKEFPTTGLRLSFQHPLSPFAFICKNELAIRNSSPPYLLYAFTLTGVAYLLNLRNLSDYESCSVYPPTEFLEFDLQTLTQSPSPTRVTSLAATMGCLVVGREDGSVACFQLGVIDKTAPGFMHELRDDVGIGRLWGFMSRGRTSMPVKDLVISEVHRRKLLFVLHVDGSLRAWDLLSHTRILNHTVGPSTLTGATFLKLWVGNVNEDIHSVPVAILYTSTDNDREMIALFNLRFNLGEKVTFLREPSMQCITLDEGRLIDLKISPNKIWVLREDGLVLYDLFDNSSSLVEANNYFLLEAFVADQLFQGSEHFSDDLIWTSLSLFSSVKDQAVPFVSSIFLRRLLHPGVHQSVALRATMRDYNKHWTDTEFHSLTVDGLRKEIFSLIESEGVADNPISVIYCWKNFCTRYFHYWCKNNTPYSLLVDPSTGAIGLIRENSITLIRGLEDVELFIYGSFDEFDGLLNSGLDLPDENFDREILFEVLRCISCISQHLGKAAAAIFYESLVNSQMISSEEVIPCLLKNLEVGYNSLAAELHVSQLGADNAWKKGLADHKSHRKFSIHMLLSLHALCNKAASWDRVLNVIENYLKFLVPRKSIRGTNSTGIFNINASILVQSTAQVAKVMFESTFDIRLLLGYLVKVSAQVHMMQKDVCRVQLELIPMIEETLSEWLILNFLGTTPSESPNLDDFSSRLSSLHIDNNVDKRSWDNKLGSSDFTLASLLFLNFESSSEDQAYISSRSFPSPNNFIGAVSSFSSWIIWGGKKEESSAFFSHSTEVAIILLKNGQHEALENLFAIIDAHLRKERTSKSVQGTNGEWFVHLHILGICLLTRAQSGLQGSLKEKKVCEAVRCFFRASAGHGASWALQNVSFEGLPHPDYIASASVAAWKLHYYQWSMQIFEQYNLSEGACQFALAALEQIDEVLGSKDGSLSGDTLNENATTVRGRLWANVFKFTLDLNNYNGAYCAIISNPDEDSKSICLRRFIIVLCEQGAFKTLCDGKLPFVGFVEKVEQELAWKAERSDVAAKSNLYKLLYAFEMHRHNWRRAASYMYRYSARLKSEIALTERQQHSVAVQERLNALSAAINALNLVHPSYAWIDPQLNAHSVLDGRFPNKKARRVLDENALSSNGGQSWKLQHCIDIEKLEKECALTSVEYSLSIANFKFNFSGNQTLPSDLVNALVQANLYDMAFTVLLKFWQGSGLQRELEQVFVAIALKCCPQRNDFRTHGLLLTSSENESEAMDTSPVIQQSTGISQWETLELYLYLTVAIHNSRFPDGVLRTLLGNWDLQNPGSQVFSETYKQLHPRLPIIVAETLLHTDSQIELPLWLVHMFKGGRRATSWGMTGQESDAASLLRLYVNYGRLTEATNLFLEYIESFASLRPADITNRKRMSAVWFPYTTIERLCFQLEELKSSGQMSDQCDKLRRLLHGALLSHLKQLKVDSHDAVSSAAC